MTKTQNSSFAATVLNALKTSGRYQTGVLKAELSLVKTLPTYKGPAVFDVQLTFSPGTISGITLASQLDKAIHHNMHGHKVHIDWDKDLVVYTREGENFSVLNFTDDPSLATQPNRVKFSAVSERHYTTVLTTFLDLIADILIDPAHAPRGKHAAKAV
jgi:hypothetical protein